MQIGSIDGKYGVYPVLVINGDVYYRDSSGRTVATGFSPASSGRYSGPDGSGYDQRGAVQEIQRRYNRGDYS